jgi:DNA-binding transcriptional LysR family regulator
MSNYSLELRHLRYFVAVADAGSVTRAAERLGIQQPPLSQQIRALEAELGMTLFDRTARGIRLNRTGSIFLEDARRLLADAGEAVHRLRRISRGEQGQLAIGFTSSAALHPRLPSLLQRFCAAHPLVKLVTRENTTRDLMEAVEQQEIDLAVVRAPVDRFATLRAITLDEEPAVAALPTTHPLAQESGPIALERLAQDGFIAYRRGDGPGIHDGLSVACRRAGFEPRIVGEVPRLLSAVIMVAAGSGVALMPESISKLHEGSVVYRALEAASSFTIPLNLAFRPRGMSRIVEQFLVVNDLGD